jgi:hypothetical protein
VSHLRLDKCPVALKALFGWRHQARRFAPGEAVASRQRGRIDIDSAVGEVAEVEKLKSPDAHQCIATVALDVKRLSAGLRAEGWTTTELCTPSTVGGMRRSGSRFLALTVSALVVFAPRPLATGAPRDQPQDRGLVIGQVLAPSVDAAESRDPDFSRSLSKQAPTVAVVLIVLLLLGVTGGAWALTTPRSLRRRLVTALSRACRAPPPLP